MALGPDMFIGRDASRTRMPIHARAARNAQAIYNVDFSLR
jgi:hypothetical protein